MSSLKKVCFKCKEEKPVEQFYRHPQMSDGRVGKCKTCNKSDVIANREKRIDYYREYDRQRGGHSAAGKKKLPEKRIAHDKVSRAIKLGLLKRPEACESCGKICRLHGHHDDYKKPLSVTFLCAVCHKARHKELGWGYVWNKGIDNAG